MPEYMYKEAFPAGSVVRAKPRDDLEWFMKKWAYHNPLKVEQLDFAGRTGRVAKVSFYHGGDVLYTIDGMPGIWHEQCLELASDHMPNQHLR
jgi:hypothetical protein